MYNIFCIFIYNKHNMTVTTIYIYHAECLYIHYAVQKSGHLDTTYWDLILPYLSYRPQKASLKYVKQIIDYNISQ